MLNLLCKLFWNKTLHCIRRKQNQKQHKDYQESPFRKVSNRNQYLKCATTRCSSNFLNYTFKFDQLHSRGYLGHLVWPVLINTTKGLFTQWFKQWLQLLQCLFWQRELLPLYIEPQPHTLFTHIFSCGCSIMLQWMWPLEGLSVSSWNVFRRHLKGRIRKTTEICLD